MSSNPSAPNEVASAALDPGTVLTVSEDVPHATLKPEEQLLLALVDGRGPVTEILRLSGMSGTTTMRMLRSLCARGLLRLVSRPPKAADEGAGEAVATSAPEPVRAGATQDLTSFIGSLAKGRGLAAALDSDLPATPRPTAPPIPRTSNRPVAGNSKRTVLGLEPVAPRRVAARPAGVAPPEAKRQTLRKGARAASGTINTRRVLPDPALDSPSRVGAYEVVAPMAQGAVGSVYLCRRAGVRQFQYLYALKAIRQHSADGDAAAQSLLTEARVGGVVRHPNVLAVVDVGFYQEQPFLLFDYVEGTTLAELLVEGIRCPPSLIVPIVIDVLRGLQAVHEAKDRQGQALGLVHCEISPHNVLVGTDGCARVTDFGGARFTLLPGEHAHDGAPMLRPAFAAPEQLKGEWVDARADLFSVGALLWTAVTGHKLFADDSYEQTVVDVANKVVMPPSAFGAPRSIDDPCLKALARDKAGRFGSAEEMAQALIKLGATEGFLPGGGTVGAWVRQAIGEELLERHQRLADVASGAIAPVIVRTDEEMQNVVVANHEILEQAPAPPPLPTPGHHAGTWRSPGRALAKGWRAFWHWVVSPR